MNILRLFQKTDPSPDWHGIIRTTVYIRSGRLGISPTEYWDKKWEDELIRNVSLAMQKQKNGSKDSAIDILERAFYRREAEVMDDLAWHRALCEAA